MKKQSNRYVLSVVVNDRIGVLRDISSVVTDMGANIDGISQTVVAGYFTVLLTATFTRVCTREDILAAIRKKFSNDKAEIAVMPFDSGVRRASLKGGRYVITMTGRDRPGILKTATTFLAEKGINLEDWYVEFSGENVTHIGEVTVPPRLDIKQFQDEFRQVVSRLGLESCIQHENIFRATNEVGSISSLLGDRHRNV